MFYTKFTFYSNESSLKKSMEKVHSFPAAVRGYHYYRRFWKPEEKQKLNCMHELNNPYDQFAICFQISYAKWWDGWSLTEGLIAHYQISPWSWSINACWNHFKTLQMLTITIGIGWNGNSMLGGYKTACFLEKYRNNREVFNTG